MKQSRIARYGVPPSAHGRACVICGEPFGDQCFGLGVATDISISLEAAMAREVCFICANRYESAHFTAGSFARIAWSFRGWWRAFRWWWPRRHQFDALKHPRGTA